MGSMVYLPYIALGVCVSGFRHLLVQSWSASYTGSNCLALQDCPAPSGGMCDGLHGLSPHAPVCLLCVL